MTEVSVTDWANYEGDLPEQYPHRQPRPGSRLGRTSPITGPDFGAYRKEKRRRLKARSPTLTVAKVEPDDRIPTFNKITFENGIVTGYPKSKNAKVGDKFVVSSQNGRFAHIMDAEEGSAPIQDPMEFGEMANWTPLDGSEGLKRKRAEDDDYEYSCDICDKPAKYNFQDSTLRWEIIDDDFADKPMWSEDSGQGFNDFYCGDCAKKQETSRFYSAESPSATIPVNYPKHLQPDWQKTPASSKKMAKEMRQALETEDPAARHAALFAMQDKYGDYWNQQSFNDAFKKEMEGSEPSWVKPVATALGFALGFLGIHEIKKVL